MRLLVILHFEASRLGVVALVGGTGKLTFFMVERNVIAQILVTWTGSLALSTRPVSAKMTMHRVAVNFQFGPRQRNGNLAQKIKPN